MIGIISGKRVKRIKKNVRTITTFNLEEVDVIVYVLTLINTTTGIEVCRDSLPRVCRDAANSRQKIFSCAVNLPRSYQDFYRDYICKFSKLCHNQDSNQRPHFTQPSHLTNLANRHLYKITIKYIFILLCTMFDISFHIQINMYKYI
jgi:hypothetical protein